MRRAFAKVVLKIPFLRRRYVRTILLQLDEGGGKKGLPPELQQLQRLLKQVPPTQRAQTLESAFLQGLSGQVPSEPEQLPSRSLRRAAERQQRKRR
jgi:hypothetical protein